MSSQYWYGTPTFKIAVATIASLVLPVLGILAVQALNSKSSQRQPHRSPAKPNFWRITGLPAHITKNELQIHLEQSFRKQADEKYFGNIRFKLNLVPHTQRHSCAIVTSILRPCLEDSNVTIDNHFHGVTPVYVPEDASIDIVMVSGLGGHALGSFRSADGWNVWLQDFVPVDIKNARILVYGYDTKVEMSDDKSSIGDLAKGLLGSLKAFRSETKTHRRPIIFVGHSLGGLLIKEALAVANNSDSTQDLNLFKSSYGLIFFGVPNLGLRNEQLCTMVNGQPNGRLINDLVVDKDSEPSTYLAELTQKFIRTCKAQEFRILSYYERKMSFTVQQLSDKTWTRTGPQTLLVTEDSARRIGLTNYNDHQPLSTDHRGLIRFDHYNDENYQQVIFQMKELSNEAVGVIHDRFSVGNRLTDEQWLSWSSLDWPPYSDFRNSSKLAKADAGTLEWLVNEIHHNTTTKLPADALNSSSYLSWQDSNKSESLLVTAPPGRGKSVLSNFVVDNLKAKSTEEPLEGCKVIYYFCSIRNEKISHNASSVLRALIVQLCKFQQPLYQKIPKDLRDNAQKFLSESSENLWSIFENMVKASPYERLYCVIDGLDVYHDGMFDLITKINTVFDVDDAKGTIRKLFCTSRPTRDVLDAWKHPGKVLNSNHKTLHCNPEDIEVFISSRVDSLDDSFSQGMKDSIINNLLPRTENTFLWLDVVIRKIQYIQFPSDKKIKEAIEQSSADLNKLYEDLVTEAAYASDDNARILALVVYAQSPLSLLALGDAVSIDPREKRLEIFSPSNISPGSLRKYLGTLLDIVEDHVYLIHQSLKDYFEKYNPLRTSFNGIEPQLVPAYVCMLYLSLNELKTSSKLPPELEKDYPLLEYAAEYWFRHIRKQEDVWDRCALLDDVLGVDHQNTPNWIKSIRGTDHLKILPKTPSEIALIYDIPWLIELLVHRDQFEAGNKFSETFMLRADKGVMAILLNHANEWKLMLTIDVLKYIVRSFNHEVVQALLDNFGEEIQITEEVIEVAAKWNYGDVMSVLLDQRGAEVKITEEVVVAAAYNHHNSDVMGVLLNRCGKEVKITENVVRAAADQGSDMLGLLIDQRGAEVKITEDVVKVAARSSNISTMGLILDRRGAEVRITEDVVREAACNYSDMMGLLLDRRGAEVEITEEVLLAVAEHSRGNIMDFLLDQRGAEIKITEKVVMAATNWGNTDVMGILLDRCGTEVKITEEVVKAAAELGGHDIMGLLLDRCGAEIKITEDIVVAAARSHSSDLMGLLLDRCGTRIEITEDVIIAAASYNSGDVMRLLLDQRGAEIKITEDVIMAAARYNSDNVMRLLLDQRGAEIKITEDAIMAAARHGSDDVMGVLLDKRGAEINITEEVVNIAARHPFLRVMKVLLTQRSTEVKITEELVKAALGDSSNLMGLLLDRRGTEINITEDVVVAAAGNESSDVMRFLLNRRRADIKITEKVVKAAAGNYSDIVMRLLLDQGGAEVKITEEVVKAAAGNESPSERILELLLDRRGEEVQITEAVVKAAAGNEYHGQVILQLLLDRRGEQVQITEAVVKAAAGNEYCGQVILKLLLDRRGEEVQITEAVVKAAAGNEFRGEGILQLLLDRRGEEVMITKDVVMAAAGNEWKWRRMWINNPNLVMELLLNQRSKEVQITEEVVKVAAGNKSRGEKILQLLLDRRGEEVRITNDIVVAAASNECIWQEYDSKMVMELLLDRRGEQVQITKEVVKAAAGNKVYGEEILRLLLDRRGEEVQITEEVVKAAAGNKSCGKKILRLLLQRRGAEVQITEAVVDATEGSEESGLKVMQLLRDSGLWDETRSSLGIEGA